MTPAEENACSKQLLLQAMDIGIMDAITEGVEFEILGGFIVVEAPKGMINAMIMNRNRVAKFLGLSSRDFKEERRTT